jgi:hypothetical protein
MVEAALDDMLVLVAGRTGGIAHTSILALLSQSRHSLAR